MAMASSPHQQQQGQQEKLSQEQIQRVMHRRDEIWPGHCYYSEAGIAIHYVRIESDKAQNPLPDLSRLKEEVPDFIQKLETDVEWCSQMLENLKSLSLLPLNNAASTEKCHALVTAMNRPNYVLQELHIAGSLSLANAAVSLSSLQLCDLIINQTGDDDDAQLSTMRDRFVESLEASNIWHLGIWGFPLSRNNFMTWLCKSSRLKSLALYNSVESTAIMDFAVEKGLPPNLQHLHLVIHTLDQLQYFIFRSALEGNLTSLHLRLMGTGVHSFMIKIFECTRHGISTLCIDYEGLVLDLVSQAKKLLEAMFGGSQASNLCHLYILHDAQELFLPRRQDQLKLVNILDTRIDFPLETIEGLKWADKSLETNCMQILKRNKVYREGGLLTKQIPPTIAKLFICGDSGAGKSTLRRNLVRKVYVPACLQPNPESTVGIRLASLKFGEKTLVICDLAGQPEFHTLHHYFVRGSDKDLFLLVCKAPSACAGPVSTQILDFENQLRYWLRFIVAHRSLTETKPRVLIVLNHFPHSESKASLNFMCEQVKQEYRDQADFVGGDGAADNINARTFRDVQKLKPKLGAALSSLLENRPRVPKLCEEIINKMNSTSRDKVMSLKDFKIKYEIDIMGLPSQHFRACITYLHDVGEVVYFESDEDESKDESTRFIIVDVQWFLRDLIGKFVPPLPRENTARELPGQIPLLALKTKVTGMCQQQDHIDYILSCLEKLGVTCTTSSDHDSTSRGSKVTILPLMQNKLENWDDEPFDNSSSSCYSFWGRRFDCKDSDQRLLPFGIFNMLQVKLASEFISRTRIGKGWLYLISENRIHIIVKIGGTRGEWYDKHWVDVLVRVPFDPEHYFLQTAEDLFQQVRTTLFQLCGAANWGCPSLELQEKVISPRYLPSQAIDASGVYDLAEIKEQISEKGMRWHLPGESTQIGLFLFPSERDEYFNNQLKDLKAVHIKVEECVNTEAELGTRSRYAEADSIDQKFELCEFRIARQVSKTIRASEERIRDELHRFELVITEQIKSIREQGINIMSKLQLHLEFEAPKYPYLTSSSHDNLLQRVSSLTLGSTSRLHFLCEHDPPHVVEKQAGIKIDSSPEWFRKAAPVLIPALRILFFALKIAAVAGFGVVIPTPESAFPKGLKEKSIDAVCEKMFNNVDGRLKKSNPSRNDMEMFHSSLTKFLKGRDLAEELGLYQSISHNQQHVWLCEKHRK